MAPDSEMLDWLEKSGASVTYRWPPPKCVPREFHKDYWERPYVAGCVDGIGWTGKTLREAISKAMENEASDYEAYRQVAKEMREDDENDNRRK